MLRSLLERSLRNRAVVLALAALFLVFGVDRARRAPLDVLPDFAPPQAVVQTEAPGFAPEQVEQLVTRPVESALGGVAGLESLRSESIQGLSVVTAVFGDGADVYRARQLLAESLADMASRLPAGVAPPRLSPLTSATMDVLKIGLQSETLTPMDLRSLAEWTLRPRLLMVPGVARVNVFGGEVRQIRIEVRPALLAARGLTLADLLAAARSASANPGAGFVDTTNQRIVIESANLGDTAEAVGDALVAQTPNGALRLRDVATVREAAAPAFGDASIRGESGVLLTLSAAYGSNTLEVTRRIEAALADLRPLFEREHVTLHASLHRPADFIESALHNLRSTLLVSSVLVVLVLLAFLRDGRAAAISLLAIPLSLLAAVTALGRLGFALDTMSLGGLAIAIGEVVDDAIVDVENIQRRLRENAVRAQPRKLLDVVLAASLEVRGSVVFATLSVALVFLPLLSLGGLAGKFFAPLAASYLIAVFASLLTALTVTPALALTVFARRPLDARPPAVQERLRARYLRLLERARRRPLQFAIPLVSACLAAVVALPFLGGELLPDFRENHLVLQVATAPGTSIAEMRRIGDVLSRHMLALPGVRTLEQQIGRAEAGEDTWGTNRSEFHVELTPGSDTEASTDAIRSLLEATPGIQSEVLSFLGDRISETISGETAEVVVSIFSEDLDQLDASAGAVAHELAQLPGAVDVRVGSEALGPHVAVRLRSERLRLYGLRSGDVLEALQTAFAGTRAGQVQRDGQPIDVAVALDESARRNPLQVAALPVTDGRGGAVPLGRVAEVRSEMGREVVLHEGGRRRQTVTCNVAGRDVAAFARDARERIAREVPLPAGSYIVFGGAAEARTAALRALQAQALLGLLGVVLLLWLATGHWRNVAILVLLAPLALAGGILATLAAGWIAGRPPALSLGSLVGLVTLIGVTTRHAIMMLSHYRHLVLVEGLPWCAQTAVRGAADRVVPVSMTALVTALALLPVALRSHQAGGEIDGPLAVVILGGLITSSALTLLALPQLALRYGRFEVEPEATPSLR